MAEKKSAKKVKSKQKTSVPKVRSDRFFNRELSWLEFNDRILHEARDVKNPLLERLKFLSITASNLDEFYIVRVASLRDMKSIDFTAKDVAGMTVSEQLLAIDAKTRQSMSVMYSTYTRSLVPQLKQHDIYIMDYDELKPEDKETCDFYFRNVLYPILTPMAVDSSRPLPLIYNRMLNLCVMLDGSSRSLVSGDEEQPEANFATLQIPNVVSRMYKIVNGGKILFVPVEKIIQANLDMLFNGQKVLASGCYRVMRNAEFQWMR